MSYEIVIIEGNLTRDPEMRYTQAGQAVSNMSIAVNDNYTNKEGVKVERVKFYRVTSWGKQAEIVSQYLKKGRSCIVQGTMVADANGSPAVFTKNDGTHGAAFEIRADVVRFTGGNGAQRTSVQEEGVPEEAFEATF